VTFIDVGQGDGIYINAFGKDIVIDAGRDDKFAEKIVHYMMPFDKTINLVIATHADSDHIGGLNELLRIYKVDNILFNGTLATSHTYESFLKSVVKQGKDNRLIKSRKNQRFYAKL